MHHLLTELLVLLVAAIVAVPLFRYFKLGAILAYLFAGIIIGPHVLAVIKDFETIVQFSELGVVFLLFIIGLELQPQRIWTMRRQIFGLGLAQMIITGLLLMAVGFAFGLSVPAAAVAGFGLALSSTAFALQILQESRQLKTEHGETAFSVLLFQDLAVIPLISIIPILGTGSTASLGWFAVGKTVAIIALFVVIGRYAVTHFFRFIALSRNQEVFTATALFVVIGSAVLMETAGLSMGTGAFLAGVLLANSDYRHELETDLAPFKALNLKLVLSKPHIVGLVVIGFILIKAVVLYALSRRHGMDKEASRSMAFILPQGGEFAFVLFATAVTYKIFSEEVSSILAAAVTVSMALTPLLFYINQRFLRTSSDISERPYDKMVSDGAEVIIAGYGRFGQIVARFLKSQGVRFTILDHNPKQIDIARRFGAKVFYGDASRHDLIESSGGQHAKIFVLAIDDVESSIETATMVRRYFPHLRIIARVRNRQHAIDLIGMGVEQIHRETFLTSLEVAKEVMLELGGELDTINRKVDLFRSHDEKLLREQFNVRDDESRMVSLTIKANADLEEILAADRDVKI